MRISDWSSDVCSSDLWVAAHLIEHGDPGMAGMMQAAMERKYSASTGERFFTAGGTHRFANFGRHGGYIPVDKALQQSVNLVFIRDRKSAGEGKSVSGRVKLGGRRTLKKKKK